MQIAPEAAVIAITDALQALVGTFRALETGADTLGTSVLDSGETIITRQCAALDDALAGFFLSLGAPDPDRDDAAGALIARLRLNEARRPDLLEHDRRSYSAAIGAVPTW
jgi:hypothetical protein